MKVMGYSLFRVTRNTDLELVEEEADDLMLAIEQELRNRNRGGVAVRLEVQASMPRQSAENLDARAGACANAMSTILEGFNGSE